MEKDTSKSAFEMNKKGSEQVNNTYEMDPELRGLYFEKISYSRRLQDLLEDIKSAALGIDFQSKIQLRNLEIKVLKKLHETEIEIKKLVNDNKEEFKKFSTQGKLFK
jgi:phosphoenolpyruvate synthase/pyruvate phosphate dikinase